MKTLKKISPYTASSLIATGNLFLIQFSDDGCSFSEVFEYAPIAFHTMHPHIQVFQVDLEEARLSEEFPCTYDFFCSPTYAAFANGELIGYTTNADEEAFHEIFEPENNYAHVEK